VYGLETVSLRYFNVPGPRQDPLSQHAAVIPNFITAFLAGQPPTIFGDGEQSRDFTCVENVIGGTSRALTAENVGGEVFNIACGERITLNDLVAELRALTGSELSPVYEGCAWETSSIHWLRSHARGPTSATARMSTSPRAYAAPCPLRRGCSGRLGEVRAGRTIIGR
jgi:nucleoside-diphosphate-sugar epimerase